LVVGPGSVVAERFVIERRAGSGGAGVVFLARDRHTGARIALKALHLPSQPAGGKVRQAAGGKLRQPAGGKVREPAGGMLREPQEARFMDEARILAELYHPAVVRYVAHGHTPDGGLYLAMEWIDGEGLDVRLGRGRLSISDTAALAGRVAEALAAAHGRGVIHRDLKPSNLLLPEGSPARAMLIDFGVAMGRAGRPQHQSNERTAVGTPGYMAPEQARGQRDLDARVDVFSLGCVLYECLTGRPAFAGEHPMGVLAKVLLEDPPGVAEVRSEVPPGLDDLVARMLSKDRELRPKDGAAVVLALAAVDGPITLPRAPPPPRARKLGSDELRLLSVAIAGPSPSPIEDPTTGSALREPLEAIAGALAPFGPQLERLADGAVVATLVGAGAATDQAAGAARCALALRAALPDRSIALATGRGAIAGRLPVGEVIDRAARMLGQGGAGPVLLDELTAGLLDPRFVIAADEHGLALHGERDPADVTLAGGRRGAPADATRLLLGRPSPFVGRDAELGHLRSRLAYCAVEHWARAVIVTGPAGSGKSRLRRELMAGLLESSAQYPFLLFGRGDPVTAGSPFGMLAPALRRAAGVLDGEPLAMQRQKIRGLSSRQLPEVPASARDAPRSTAPSSVPPSSAPSSKRVAEFLGELAGVPFLDDDSVQLRAARRDAVLMGDQMRRAFEDFIAAECAVGPVLIVLEDLQWGDLPSLGFVGAALRNLAHAPLFVLALARPEVHELFPSLWKEYGAEEVRLGPLPREAGVALVKFALDVGDDIAFALADRAGGDAFYLEELIRHVARLGMPSSADPLPQTVLAMVEARLGALDPEARRVLRAASVFGNTFFRGGVAALLGEDSGTSPDEGPDRSRLDEVLAALDARELTVRRPESRFPGEEEHAFRSALVRDAAYAMLTEADRALGHRLAGAFLSAAGEADAAVLAEHFERGGEPERAAGCYLHAAHEALEGDDLEAAIALAERGLGVLGERTERGSVRLGGARPMELGTGPSLGGSPGELAGALLALQATAHRWRGRNGEALRCGLSAIAQLPRRSGPWYSAAAEIAIASMKLGDIARLDEIGETLRDLCEQGYEGERHAIACARVATQLLQAGRRELSDALFGHLDHAAGAAAEEPSVVARIEQARAVRALYDGDCEENLARMEAAAQAFEAAGDLRNAHAQRVNMMSAQLDLGAYEEVEHAMREALAAAERMGLPTFAALARCNLGVALRARGALDEARAASSEAARAFAAQGDLRLEGVSRSNLALVLAETGDLEGAACEAREAVEKVAKNGPARAYALAALARVELARGQVTEALDAAREAMLAALGGIEEGESAVLLVHAEALAAAGNQGAAIAAIAAARARLESRARRITDPARRESFLGRVPENARTLELARAWVGESWGDEGGSPGA
jgi:serine/threonine protein kinase/predicted ATPase